MIEQVTNKNFPLNDVRQMYYLELSEWMGKRALNYSWVLISPFLSADVHPSSTNVKGIDSKLKRPKAF